MSREDMESVATSNQSLNPSVNVIASSRSDHGDPRSVARRALARRGNLTDSTQ